MIQALWSASSGMLGQQVALDTTANNLANINTTGYKKSRAEFQDLLYSEMRTPQTRTLRNEIVPNGYQIGNGIRLAGTTQIFSQGIVQKTGNPLDVAIEGNAFFTIRLSDGSTAYTRDGSFKLDADGALVTGEGYSVLDENMQPLVFDSLDSVKIDGNGIAYNDDKQVGQLAMAKFKNPMGLSKTGSNLYRASENSGDVDVATSEDFKLIPYSLEGSNVDMAEEMTNIMIAQRAYELSSKSIKTSDEMLGVANQLLKR